MLTLLGDILEYFSWDFFGGFGVDYFHQCVVQSFPVIRNVNNNNNQFSQ